MNAPSGIQALRPQVTVLRPLQLETPDSYLARLCSANAIDVGYIQRLATARRRYSGRPDELGIVIAELGGPAPEHFRREHARAFNAGESTFDGAFATTSAHSRPGCQRCAAGNPVQTYDHRRFMICLRHNRWIGHRPSEQRQLEEHHLRGVEKRFRRTMATGLISRPAHDAVVAALARHSVGLEYGLGHVQPAHPGIDGFAARTRLLHILARYLARHWPVGREIAEWHRRPEQARAYEYLRGELTWLGSPAANWRLIDDLVQVLLDIVGSRIDPYVAPAPSI